MGSSILANYALSMVITLITGALGVADFASNGYGTVIAAVLSAGWCFFQTTKQDPTFEAADAIHDLLLLIPQLTAAFRSMF